MQTEAAMNQDFTNQSIGLSVSQAAKHLGVSIASIRRWTDQGALNCFRTPGNQRRFSLRELDRFAAETKEKA